MTSRGVIFDLDETLYRERRYALGGYAAVAAAVARAIGLPSALVFRSLVASVRRGRRAVAFQEACERFGLDAAWVEEWVRVYRAHEPRLRLPAGSARVLRHLRPAWRLGVLTNGLPAVQRAKVRALGLEALVDAVVYAEEHGAGRGKPDAACFGAVLARLGTTPDRAVVVGDDMACDVAGGRAAGLRAVWLRRAGRSSPPKGLASHAPGGMGPDAVIDSLDELPAVLERFGVEVHHAD